MVDGGAAARSPGAIATVLGVRPDEVERVRGLFRAAFVLGVGLVLFYSSANAIFLTRYDVTVLPWVYIVNAVVVIVVGLAYASWSSRVPVGSVEVRTPDGTVARLDEGTVFGEMAILDPSPRSATVTALTDVELLVVSRATVLALAERRPAVMAEIARVLARRLRSPA